MARDCRALSPHNREPVQQLGHPFEAIGCWSGRSGAVDGSGFDWKLAEFF